MQIGSSLGLAHNPKQYVCCLHHIISHVNITLYLSLYLACESLIHVYIAAYMLYIAAHTMGPTKTPIARAIDTMYHHQVSMLHGTRAEACAIDT